jgi:hypothetical protein
MPEGMPDGMPESMPDGMPDGMSLISCCLHEVITWATLYGRACTRYHMRDKVRGGMPDGMPDGTPDGMLDGTYLVYPFKCHNFVHTRPNVLVSGWLARYERGLSN